MITPFDQLAKAILSTLLQAVARVETGREIPDHVLIADLWVEPTATSAAELSQLGLLGRIISCGPCLIEPFSRPPGMSDIRSCILEQYALNHARVCAAERNGDPEPRFSTALDPRLRTSPIGARRHGAPADGVVAQGVLAEAGVRRVPSRRDPRSSQHAGYPDSASAWPRQGFARAVRDLVALPEDALSSRLLIPVLIAFRREIPQDSIIEEEDMQSLQEIQAAYREWRREAKDEGKDEGRREGLVAGIEALCAVLDIELSGARQRVLATQTVEQLEALLAELKASRRWPGS